jgi:hypothetical protein
LKFYYNTGFFPEEYGMSTYTNLLKVSIIVVLLFAGCKDNPAEPSSEGSNDARASSVSGRILDSLNAPIFGALILDQGSFYGIDTSAVDGAFRMNFQLTANYTTSFIVRLSGYFADTVTVTVQPGDDLQLTIHLRRDIASPIIPNTDNYPAKIKFISTSANDIFVAGVGSIENATLVYEVQDSLGFPIRPSRRAVAHYSLKFFPNTFTNVGTPPQILPDTAITDDEGKIKVNIVSGTQAGVAQVIVTVDLGSGLFLTSLPVKISVHAGFPDQRHFTIAMGQFNFPGLDYNYVKDVMTVLVADKYSNPVAKGTAVYFNTSHGAVTTGYNLTNDEGFVDQTLFSANPRPEYIDTLNTGPGWTYVYARTLGEGNSVIIDSALVLWTGAPIVTVLSSPTPFADSGGSGPWTIRVWDRYRHPMSSGTVISVGAGEAVVTGDVPTTMPDAFFPGPGITDFTFSLSKPEGTIKSLKVSVSVVVNHPVAAYSLKVTIASGVLP